MVYREKTITPYEIVNEMGKTSNMRFILNYFETVIN